VVSQDRPGPVPGHQPVEDGERAGKHQERDAPGQRSV
jgi:hypothetical protein